MNNARIRPTAMAFIVAGMMACAAMARAEVKPLLAAAAGGRGGPTVLVVGEPTKGDLSIEMALQQAASWTLERGRIVTASMAEMEAAIAAERPEAVIVLRTARSKGEHATLETRGVAGEPLLAALNGLADEKSERLALASGEAELPAGPGEAVRLSLIIKVGGTVPAARTRLFRNAIHSVLVAHDMTHSDPWTLVRRTPGVIDVALYVGAGANATPGVSAYPKCLAMDADVRCTFVGEAELAHPGLLKQFDVVVFPGGMSNTQGHAIGKDGAKAVTDFIRGGGGYVSSCAGSYLASTSYPWSLRLINSEVLDPNHWLRGTGDVDIELTDEGRQILGDFQGLVKCHYANGPLLAAAKEAGLGAFTPLAYFRSDMAKSAPGGIMPNTPAIIAAACGQGRVLCFSPHPEYTDALNGFVGRAVHWVAHKPVPTDSHAATTQPAAGERHTPFVTVLMRDWPKWDANHDDVLSVAEVERAVADRSVTGNDAAAVAAIKLLARTTNVGEPMTRAYFEQYDRAAIPFVGTERLTDGETIDLPVADEPAAPRAGRAKALKADFDLYFVKCKARLARAHTGGAPAWPAEITEAAALEHACQGPLGDCFFVASIGSTVVHRPAALRQWIEPLPDGRYRANFPGAAAFTFDGLTEGQVAISSTTAGDGAWLAVLEQAFGKYRALLRGQSIDVDGTEILRRGGDSAVTIQQLTGHATRRIHFPLTAERRVE